MLFLNCLVSSVDDGLCRIETTSQSGSVQNVVHYMFKDEVEDNDVIQLANELYTRLTTALLYKCALKNLHNVKMDNNSTFHQEMKLSYTLLVHHNNASMNMWLPQQSLS